MNSKLCQFLFSFLFLLSLALFLLTPQEDKNDL